MTTSKHIITITEQLLAIKSKNENNKKRLEEERKANNKKLLEELKLSKRK